MDDLNPIERLPDEILYRILLQLLYEDYSERPPSWNPWTQSPHVLNFCLAQKRFCRAYSLCKSRTPESKLTPIFKLSNEILENILENLVHNSGKLIPIDHRASLSVESFQSMPPQSWEDTNITTTLSRTCKKFYSLLLGRQFARVSIRCSEAGFNRLQFLVKERPRLAEHVKKFSYMIPVFYHRGLSQLQVLFDETHAATVDLERQVNQRGTSGNARRVDRSRPSLKQLRVKLDRNRKDKITIFRVLSRAREQAVIINNRIDIQSLLRAFRLFDHLQQVRLMRVQDKVDTDWASFLRERRWIAISRNNNNNNNVTDPILSIDLNPLEWTAACEHSARALGYAFLESDSPATRFSSRFVNPRIPLLLNSHSHNTISTLANRLTCLEIQIQEPTDDKMHQLSSLFNTFFTSAHQIQGLHIGFPSNRPLTHVPLEAVFHNVTWENLRYVGFGAWHLDSEEIIGLLRRHKHTLRSVRLRSVKLKEGSKWTDVVRMLRRELRELKWVSLRGIGYVGGNEGGNGVIVGVAGNGSGNGNGNGVGGFVQHVNQIGNPNVGSTVDDDDDSDESDQELDFEDTTIGDRVLSHHSSSIHLANSTSTPNKSGNLEGGREAESGRRGIEGAGGAVPSCECENGFGMADLGDEGSEGSVSKHHWKFWELWAVKRCAVHDGDDGDGDGLFTAVSR
ncbi:hypothetical protein SBOR_0414 [Sclerotinia borealis F-4128]|uniref:Uncharacterized protein n=1 Tax=Sclerotinia borealis (strain F-4128) TaxID=1432307 RepID=W9CQV0_SCLBF|nr:hypothetical protein SBOR_0414 [Sclerotinia borealis F-4128]